MIKRVNGGEAAALLLETELTPGQQKILKELWDVFLVGWNDEDGQHRAVVPKSRYVLQQARRPRSTSKGSTRAYRGSPPVRARSGSWCRPRTVSACSTRRTTGR